MVLFFSDPQSNDLDADLNYITRLCDQYNIPFATNVATAEMLIHGLERGRLGLAGYHQPQNKALYRVTRAHAPGAACGGAAEHAGKRAVLLTFFGK